MRALASIITGLNCLLILQVEAVDSSIAAFEANIQGGTSSVLNVDEAAAGYIHVKYHAPLTSSRKAYFQFNLTNHSPVLDHSANLTIFFHNTYQQRVQLWALNQPYPNFDSEITWNNAHANDTNSNSLLTSGTFTASPIGTDALIPANGMLPFSFTIPRLGDFLFENKITLVLTALDHPSNNAAGLRLITNSASLSFSTTNTPPSETNHFDVYFVGGQSNMDGRGDTNDLTGEKAFWNQSQTNVQIFYANPSNNNPADPTYNTGWQVFKPGFCVPPGFSGPLPSPRFGPDLSFAKSITDTNPNRRIALIKVSKGGTSLSSNWKPSSGYMYATFTNIAQIALGDLANEGFSYTIRGMIWHQGESDSTGSALANYETNMIQLIAAVRRDLGIGNLPFVIGEIATNKSAELRTLQFNLSQNLPFVGFASADALQTADGTHFNSDSVLILGERFAAGLEKPLLQFTNILIAGENITLTASGLGKSTFRILSSTNLNVSLAQWKSVSTNIFNEVGLFQATFSLGSFEQFYSLQAQ